MSKHSSKRDFGTQREVYARSVEPPSDAATYALAGTGVLHQIVRADVRGELWEAPSRSTVTMSYGICNEICDAASDVIVNLLVSEKPASTALHWGSGRPLRFAQKGHASCRDISTKSSPATEGSVTRRRMKPRCSSVKKRSVDYTSKEVARRPRRVKIGQRRMTSTAGGS